MEEMTLYRKQHYACITPETYKYFFSKSRIQDAWKTLSEHYGDIKFNDSFNTQEIQHINFIIRATQAGNPATIIRLDSCQETDIDELHQLLEFKEDEGH